MADENCKAPRQADQTITHPETATAPPAAEIVANLPAWRGLCRRLSNAIWEAEKIVQAAKDKEKDIPGWRFETVSYEKIKCRNEDCPGGWYGVYFDESGARWCEGCFRDRDKITKAAEGTWAEAAERAKNPEEWDWRLCETSRVLEEDIECINTYAGNYLSDSVSCWFRVNDHRLGEYEGSWYLRGASRGIALCDMCWGDEDCLTVACDIIKARYCSGDGFDRSDNK